MIYTYASHMLYPYIPTNLASSLYALPKARCSNE